MIEAVGVFEDAGIVFYLGAFSVSVLLSWVILYVRRKRSKEDLTRNKLIVLTGKIFTLILVVLYLLAVWHILVSSRGEMTFEEWQAQQEMLR